LPQIESIVYDAPKLFACTVAIDVEIGDVGLMKCFRRLLELFTFIGFHIMVDGYKDEGCLAYRACNIRQDGMLLSQSTDDSVRIVLVST
jgi:hypothetical protein